MSLNCIENAELAACAKAKGWPAAPQTTSGEDAPEGAVTGYWPGDLYMRTTTSKLYAFNGTAGENTGWNILN